MGGVCNTHGRNVYKILVRKPEGKGPLTRPKRRWAILKGTLKKGLRIWTDLSDSG